MSLTSTPLTTSVANVYVASENSVVTVIYVANYSTDTNATFSMHLVASGESESSNNIVYSNLVVNAGDTYIISTEKLVIDTNEAIKAKANSDNVLSTTVSYTNI
jgi:hypothetical protein